ncbi:MAG: hypothetical protein ACYTEU_04250, partial [Planctomycetota bacterium]
AFAMLFIIILIIEVMLLLSVLFFSYVKKYKIAASFVNGMIFTFVFFMGFYVSSKVHLSLLPYAVFGSQQVQEEKIHVTYIEEGVYHFSNGESIRNPKFLFPEIARIGFGFLSMFLLLISMKYIVICITQKVSPDLYSQVYDDELIRFFKHFVQ